MTLQQNDRIEIYEVVATGRQAPMDCHINRRWMMDCLNGEGFGLHFHNEVRHVGTMVIKHLNSPCGAEGGKG